MKAMQETYVVQSMIRYWKSYLIPVPDDFPIHPDYLIGCDRENFIAGFKQLHATVGQIYDDMYKDPARYGLPLFEIAKFPVATNEYRAAGHAVYRLGNLIYNLGQASELADGELAVDLERYRITSKGKAVPNANIILGQLPKFGFELAGFNGKNFDKGVKVLRISYPDHPEVMAAFKAFTETVSPEKHDNRRRICKNFYLFHHRLFRAHTGEPPESDLSDFAQVIGADNRAFFSAFHQQMVDRGYEAQYNPSYDWKLDYYRNQKYSYHFCLLDHDDFQLRLKMNNVGAYADFLETCPEQIQGVFLQNPPCLRCRETCPMRVEYEFRGAHHESCVCSTFNFRHPKVEEIDYYLKLIELEDTVKLNNRT